MSSPAEVSAEAEKPEELLSFNDTGVRTDVTDNNVKPSVSSASKDRTVYLIDFENVGLNALDILDVLDPDLERICLFSTQNTPRISTAILAKISEILRHNSDAFEVHEVPVKNQSVDMHLVSYLGYLIGVYGTSFNYVINSSDSDYDNIVEYWKTHKKVNVKRVGKQAITPKSQVEIEVLEPSETEKEQVETASEQSPEISVEIPSSINWNIVMQRALSAAGFSPTVGGQVASIVCKSRDDANFPSSALQKLKSSFPNNEKLLETVKATFEKSLVKTEADSSTSPLPSYKAPRSAKKTKSLKNAVINILSEAKVVPDAAAEIAEIAAEHYDKDNAKQAIHGALVKKYEQTNGLKIYNLLKHLF